MRASAFIGLTIVLFLSFLILLKAQTVIDPTLTLTASGIVDQDDMCIWIHQTNKSMSTVITSDKGANKLFIYDLSGNVLQTIDVPGMPGNIDIRYNFVISGIPTDIVGYNDRTNGTIVFYKVDRATRLLSFVSEFSDSGMTGNNYGFCLYHSLMTDKYYAIASSNSTQMKQWELIDKGGGTIGSILKRTWNNGTGDITEGLVADDELGILYAANEGEGIYKYDAEPTDPNPTGELIAPTGTNGLTADVEGITLYYSSQGNGYLIASSQGSSNFKVYERQAPHSYINNIQVTGVGSTDGIDVTNLSLGPLFTFGLFLVHDGTGLPYVIRGCRWEDFGLDIDTTYWNPANLPNSPTDLLTSTVSQTQIDLSWTDNSSDENGFKIERKQEPGGVYTEIGTVEANVVTYQDTGLTANTEYCYRVRAYNTAGNSGYSNENCAITGPNIPTPPGNLIAEATGVNQVTLNWTDNSNNEKGFIIERENATWFDFSAIDTVLANSTSYIDSSVNQGVSYYYRVSAFNISGQSVYSNTFYVTTILPAPANLVGQLIGGPPYSVVLNWQESSNNELGFVIERDTLGYGTFESLDTVAVNAISYEDSNFVNAVDTFFYRVYAFSQDTVSDYSNIAEIIIPVELISFSAIVFKNSVIISWSTATETNNMGFELERKMYETWDKLGFIEGRGSTTEESNYIYNDEFKYQSFKGVILYRLKQIDFSGIYEYSNFIEVNVDFTPKEFPLYQNYPNPFNPVTIIKFSVPEAREVKLTVFNFLGEEVAILFNGFKNAGYHQVEFEASRLPSGIYFCLLQAVDPSTGSGQLFVGTKKMVLLR